MKVCKRRMVFSKYETHKREFSELANNANNSFEIRPFEKFAFQARRIS